MTPTHTNAIIAFIRFPVKGKVKTRLASDIGDELAYLFYKKCAEYTFAELTKLRNSNFDIYIYGSNKSDINKIINWSNKSFYYAHQKGYDLGKRIYNAFTEIFNGSYKRVVIIGSDLPSMNDELIKNAFHSLAKNDCVIGPANDGGYYLLGLREKVIDLFTGIAWSTKSVLKETIYMLKKHNATFCQMEELIDIDTKEDLFRWYSENKLLDQHPVKIFVDTHKSEM